ncbi:MAG: hypothetical protein F4149_09260 [Gammaproteobacteria bacterium]|nr:hypothetical protein [Gammaproteobacteria bacterium]
MLIGPNGIEIVEKAVARFGAATKEIEISGVPVQLAGMPVTVNVSVRPSVICVGEMDCAKA